MGVGRHMLANALPKRPVLFKGSIFSERAGRLVDRSAWGGVGGWVGPIGI